MVKLCVRPWLPSMTLITCTASAVASMAVPIWMPSEPQIGMPRFTDARPPNWALMPKSCGCLLPSRPIKASRLSCQPQEGTSQESKPQSSTGVVASSPPSETAPRSSSRLIGVTRTSSVTAGRRSASARLHRHVPTLIAIANRASHEPSESESAPRAARGMQPFLPAEPPKKPFASSERRAHELSTCGKSRLRHFRTRSLYADYDAHCRQSRRNRSSTTTGRARVWLVRMACREKRGGVRDAHLTGHFSTLPEDRS